MSETPIHFWFRSHLPKKVSTDPKAAVHLFGGVGRAYCGHRGGTRTASPEEVTCSACISAATADAEAGR